MNAEMIHLIAWTIGIPMLVSGVLILWIWKPWRDQSKESQSDRGVALGISLSFILAQAFVQGSFSAFPPPFTWLWTSHLMVLAGLFGLLCSLERTPYWMKWPSAFLLSVLMAVFLVPDFALDPQTAWVKEKPLWIQNHLGLWWFALGISTFFFWKITEDLADESLGATFPFLYGLLALGASGFFLQVGIAKFAHLSGALTAVCGVLVVIGALFPALSCTRGAAFCFTVFFPGLLWSAYFTHYSTVPFWCFPLLLFFPLFPKLANLSLFEELKPWKYSALRCFLLALPLSAFLSYLFFGLESTQEPYSGY
jgi:hypothetical protein